MAKQETHDQAYLYKLRHSAAHLLAHAVLELFPETLLTLGPPTEDGFFYDFLPKEHFKEKDLALIEERMHEITKRGYTVTEYYVSKEKARELFADNKFKLELINGIDAPEVGIAAQGDFFDLCRGGHVHELKEIKHFKLMSLAGSYWRADKNKDVLQRIWGAAFKTKEELDTYLTRIEEAQLYDHRRLGKQLDLFSFHPEAPGMPFFHDKGNRIFQALVNYSRACQDRAGYQEIKTPLLLHEQLWHTSGHYENYRDNMYFTKVEDEINCIRPMNCPCSILVYRERPHSYRELPLRLAEFGQVHRHELSGVLHGLCRVRTFTTDDAHIYCTPEQIEHEVIGVLKLADTMYKRFGFEHVQVALSTRPKNSIGSDELWETATKALKDALTHHGIAYTLQEGEGAFYGPKIELHITDAMGRSWQCGTVQVDFFLPKNFGIEYIASDQSRNTPVIIHRAIYGSIERFMAILLEHHKGHLPFWLSPVQARILVITDAQREYASALEKALKDAHIRVEIDNSGDQISAQIRRAQTEKIPWMLVLGKKEQESGTITLRHASGKQEFGISLVQLLEWASELTRF